MNESTGEAKALIQASAFVAGLVLAVKVFVAVLVFFMASMGLAHGKYLKGHIHHSSHYHHRRK